jgi:hypothetical protein
MGGAMTTLAGHGLAVELPRGWEGAISWREAGEGETTHPVLHAGSFPLPSQRGDFGSRAVDRMGPQDAFVVVLEYHPDSVGNQLFARVGLPRALDPGDFSTSALQRPVVGQAGTQAFFNEAGRAFCLYVVLGAYRNRTRVLPTVNQVLGRIRIDGP